MFSRKQLLVAVVLFFAPVTLSHAGVIVNLDFNGKGSLGRKMTNVTAHHSNGSYSGWAGQLKVTLTGGASFNFDGDQLVYCTEITEYAGRNDDYYLDTLNNLNLPTSGPQLTLSQKVALEKLFSLVDTVDTDFEAAGFQVAVWEVSQDVNYGDLTNPNAGNFYLTGSGSNYTNILSSANYYLSELENQNQVSVLGMISDGAQDFLHATPPSFGGGLSTVPEPAALTIFGMIGLVACQRRRGRG